MKLPAATERSSRRLAYNGDDPGERMGALLGEVDWMIERQIILEELAQQKGGEE